MVNNAPLVHVSGYARGMTQATDWATVSGSRYAAHPSPAIARARSSSSTAV